MILISAKQHLHELEKLRPLIIENLSHADMCGVSNETFLYPCADDLMEAYAEIGKYCKNSYIPPIKRAFLCVHPTVF